VSLVVLLILAVVWAVFLIPQVARVRAEKTPADTVGAFRHQLSVLERTNAGNGYYAAGTGVAAPMARALPLAPVTRATVAQRRRAIAVFLLAGMGVTLLLGMLPPLRPLLMLHLVLDALFVGYLGLLARARTIAAERDTKVRYLPERPFLVPEPSFLLQRSGS
jgi:hypothetical protein